MAPLKIKNAWTQTSLFYITCCNTTNYTINDCSINESEIICYKIG